MRTLVGLGASALMALATVAAFAHRTPPPLAPTSLGVEHLHFNALTMNGERLLAAGAMGEILYTDNQGGEWKRANVKQDRQALLVSMAFSKDKKVGMAVGHEGWILRTQDGGKTWEEVAFDKENGEPLMSIAQLPSGEWVAVGAFGRALHSLDGGNSWQAWPLPEEVQDKHLNRIAHSDDGQYWLIAGELGLLVESKDFGQTWHMVPPFYNGSFYNAMALPNGGWLTYGMRGNVYRKADAHSAWQQSTVGAPVSFFSHTLQADGNITLVGQGATIGVSNNNGQSFSLQKVPGRATLTDVVQSPNGKTWIASTSGIQTLPTAAPGEAAARQGASK